MKPRHAVALAACMLIGAILIYALLPRYYLIAAFPDKTMVQLGPFVTEAACESARREIPETVFGNRELDAKDKATVSGFMVCLALR
jgi:hypothetical protein